MSATRNPPDLVVGVGASAGGLDAFKQLLSALPDATGMAFLLVQHLDPSHKSFLAELLSPSTGMTVTEAHQGVAIEPDTVYIARADMDMAVRDGKIELSPPALQGGVRRPVDHLFRSLARDRGPCAAAIVLSGSGSDGSAGIRAVKAAGGLTIAQEPAATDAPGMSRNAIASGAVDAVLAIAQIPVVLARFAGLPPRARGEHGGDDDEPVGPLSFMREGDLERLAHMLEAQQSFDLRVYKPTTVERRVVRRMALSGFEDVQPYLDHLRAHPIAQQTLVRDMLISVTDFFRDPDAFAALREMVIEPMVAQATAGDTLRVWVPGCATGEEAYSLAIEFLEAIEVYNERMSVQVFATDIDQDALAFGRAAIYPPSIADRVSERRLDAFFKPRADERYQVRPALRDTVSFAVHDLTKDPPFSRMNLVSCRNVLIYLTAEAQQHVLDVLHFALNPQGCLFLSTSESIGAPRNMFSTISKPQRIYQQVGAASPIAVAHSRPRGAAAVTNPPPTPRARPQGTGDLARRAVLRAYVPPTIVVAEDGAVLYTHGDLGRYLRFPQDESPRFELSLLLRPEIATRTRGALYKCRRTRQTVVARSSPDDGSVRVRIVARPAEDLGDDDAVILSFEPVEDGPVALAIRPDTGGDEGVVEQLEQELRATREDLRNTVEELETSNEELRTSNEESLSMNEELQSANEELEATTEELRSLNEELTTVNSQLREKVEQLEQAHDDLHNFFASTKIATVFLDDRLCVKRFTPAARALLSIDDADTGRCIVDMARELLQNDLDRDAKMVLEHLSMQSRELRLHDGRWIARQVLPYRTENRRIEGVVVTFTDVTAPRSANEELEAKRRRLELAWEAARGGIFEHRVPLDASTYHSDQWAQILGYRRDELPAFDRFLPWLIEQVHPDDLAMFKRTYVAFVNGRSERYRVELRLRHRDGHWIWVRGISKALDRDPDGRVRHVLGMMIDITDLKQVEEELRESESRFREMADGLPLMVWLHDASGDLQLVNETYCEFFGVRHEDITGRRWQVLVHPEDAETYTQEFYACVVEHRPFHAEARVRDANGTWRWIESWGRPRRTEGGEFRGFVGTSVDITERRQVEEGLRDSEERFRNLADNISQLAWMAHGNGWIFWYNKRWHEYTGTTLEDMEGWGWRSMHHPDHVDRVVAKVRHCFEAGQVWEDTFPLRGADGEYRWFLSRAVPIHDERGAVVRWFGTNTDVTHQREVEQKLVEAGRQKDEFLAMLGHELRNPLAAIRTASELLKLSAEGDSGLARTQAILERQTGHMAKLLDGLLDISRIIRGKITLEREVLDFAALCRDVTTDLTDVIARRELELRLDLPAEPIQVEGDRVRLSQVVDNLLSNAVKYTPDGGAITLVLRREDETAVLSVRDTGIGIEPELLPHIFDTFRQSKQSIDRSYGGLGLGLALVKSLAELHGGTVEANSEGKDRGAEFVIRIPISRAPGPRPDDPGDLDSRALHILLIEDNEDAAEMLRQLLELSGYHVVIAATGRSGVAIARRSPPDVILCDLGLPDGMSGFDVASELRGDPHSRGIPLVALSGYGRPEDKARSAEAGFDVHLTKPIDVKALERVVNEMSRAARDARDARDDEA